MTIHLNLNVNVILGLLVLWILIAGARKKR
jgi:hypothetical protein